MQSDKDSLITSYLLQEEDEQVYVSTNEPTKANLAKDRSTNVPKEIDTPA